jgi:NitT/TauT family transport system substrate-binding protein
LTRPSRAGVLASAAALALAAPLATRAQAQLSTLRVGTSPADGYAQPWFAQEQGFFTRAGLTVDVQSLGSGSAAASGLLGGSLDIAVTTPIPVANAVIRGVPFGIIASAAVNTVKAPQLLIVVRKSGAVRTPKDFIGKTVAVVTLKTLLELGLDIYLSKGGVEPSQVRVVEMGFSAMGPAIDRGTIDAAVMGEPFLSAALKTNDVRVLVDPMADVAPRLVTGVWITRQQFAQRNPEAVRRFAAVMYETARWANAHHAESAAILAKVAKLNPDDIGAMIRAEFAEQTRPAEIQAVLDACAQYNYIGRPMRAAELMLRA